MNMHMVLLLIMQLLHKTLPGGFTFNGHPKPNKAFSSFASYVSKLLLSATFHYFGATFLNVYLLKLQRETTLILYITDTKYLSSSSFNKDCGVGKNWNREEQHR